MLQITKEFKEQVITELLNQRNNFDGSDKAFASQYGISSAVFSRLKSGETDGLIKDNQFLTIGREFNINLKEHKWQIARTTVFTKIENDLSFCQAHSKAMIFVDECDLGKSTAARYLSRKLKNCFYIDASESKTRQLFIRSIAKRIGVNHNGKYAEVKANLKYYLKQLPNPLVIIDEAGDLDYPAFLELKELWNATEGACGWYMMGADGLREKIERGIRNSKVGFAEIFRRFSGNYQRVSPVDSREREAFHRELITDVLKANMKDDTQLNHIVNKCLVPDSSHQFGKKGEHHTDRPFAGLTRAESLLILNAS